MDANHAAFAVGALLCWWTAAESIVTGWKRRLWLFLLQGALFAWVALVYSLVACGKIGVAGYARYIYPMTPFLYAITAFAARLVRDIIGRKRGRK